MKKKGFTLIELLAVIVVLAIISLIATPIVMNTIKSAKKGAAERSAERYASAVETMIASKRMEGIVVEDGLYTITSEGNITKDGTTYEVEMSGDYPNGGSIAIQNSQVVPSGTSMTIGDYTITIDSTGKATASGSGETTLTVYRWSQDSKSIGDTLNSSEYTTDPTTLGKNYYFKHVLDGNKIIESYACANINNKEVCTRGGDPNYYGYAEDPANYTGNALILKGLDDEEGVNCFFSVGGTDCLAGPIMFSAEPGGRVYAHDSITVCDVFSSGNSNCGSVW